MPIEIIEGDILEAKEKYIVHQCNCVSNKSAGLAKFIFEKFPYSDVYTNRTEPDVPGTIKISGDGIKNRFIINMFGQYYPGKPKSSSNIKDDYNARSDYFLNCLKQMKYIQDIESIAFPYYIGCGLAGGKWKNYNSMIHQFAGYILAGQNAEVVMYKLQI